MSAAGIGLRRAVPEDVAPIAGLQIASWRAAYQGIIDAVYLETMDFARHAIMWQRAMDAAAHVLVAECDEQVIGFANAHGNEITVLYVDPKYWRRGAGRLLLRGMLADLANAGQREAWLWALKSNAAARAFYRAEGGQERDSSPAKVGLQTLSQIRYVWSLPVAD